MLRRFVLRLEVLNVALTESGPATQGGPKLTVPLTPTSPVSVFLQPPLGKLPSAAPAGDAAVTTRPENHIIVLHTRGSLLEALVAGAALTALVDTGTEISVMSSNLRRRLQKFGCLRFHPLWE